MHCCVVVDNVSQDDGTDDFEEKLSQEIGADVSGENLPEEVGADVLAQEVVAGEGDSDEEVAVQAEDIWLTVHATPPAKSSNSDNNKQPTYDVTF